LVGGTAYVLPLKAATPEMCITVKLRRRKKKKEVEPAKRPRRQASPQKNETTFPGIMRPPGTRQFAGKMGDAQKECKTQKKRSKDSPPT